MKLIRAVSIVMIVLLSAVLWQWQKISQVYYAATLFWPHSIVDNFSNMDRAFNSVKLQQHQAKPWVYEFEEIASNYQFRESERSVNEFLERSNTTALIVFHQGKIRFEQYYLGTTANDRRISWSMAKSYLSALFGIAVAEGHIRSINQPVTDYVPSLLGTGYQDVTIKQVLQMSSGVAFNEDYGDFFSDINRFGRTIAFGGTFDDFATTLDNERVPGTYMHYVSIDTHVLGMVLRAATGQTYLDYFEQKLWSKLGSESNAYYVADDTGEPMVLGGLNMMSRDYLRLGVAFLNNGKIQGEQVIPVQWIQASTIPDAAYLMPGKRENSDHVFGYGYQWWVPEESEGEFFAWGIYGQFIYINQNLDTVIVKNSANTQFMDNDFNDPYETIEMFRGIARDISKGKK
ncbi:serine hydrolase [Psychrobium sp. 1_MG-2023]|uniref:serine hydrolase domain-containing protein n=1 Tax=Psychrobium sp. 1_MG-2023 TaxID=3062624 RepID=UPI000C34BF81|nr:serine hydrolase [Psychrobium sp. 1_MG-2023]MDP2561140.1 serine hydrolase [Psychrobium sp. 1_MG-2023]PKF55155.1 serine hydrolase [Alteromonadales bacterium alter-6D02]